MWGWHFDWYHVWPLRPTLTPKVDQVREPYWNYDQPVTNEAKLCIDMGWLNSLVSTHLWPRDTHSSYKCMQIVWWFVLYLLAGKFVKHISGPTVCGFSCLRLTGLNKQSLLHVNCKVLQQTSFATANLTALLCCRNKCSYHCCIFRQNAIRRFAIMWWTAYDGVVVVVQSEAVYILRTVWPRSIKFCMNLHTRRV